MIFSSILVNIYFVTERRDDYVIIIITERIFGVKDLDHKL